MASAHMESVNLYQVSCEDCPYTATSRTERLALSGLARHSCERQWKLAARAERVAERLAYEGEKRDCQHKRAHHEHGTRTAYVADRCRCRPCIDANNAEQQARNKAIAYGRYDNGLVPAGPVLEHLEALRAAGIGTRVIAGKADVARTTLRKILNGRKRVARDVAERILALAPTDDTKPDHALVHATGTHRRIQALVAGGRSVSAIGARLGITPPNMHALLHQRAVTAATAREVKDLYEQLRDVTPPAGTHRERITVSRARNYATARGWATSLAWDDETIDDPATKPLAEAPAQSKTEALIEDVRFMLSTGASPEEVCRRLEKKAAAVERALLRAGERGLARWFRTGDESTAA